MITAIYFTRGFLRFLAATRNPLFLALIPLHAVALSMTSDAQHKIDRFPAYNANITVTYLPDLYSIN